MLQNTSFLRAGCFLFFWAGITLGMAGLAFLLFIAPGFVSQALQGTGPGGQNPLPGGGNAPTGAVTYRGSDSSGDLPLISERHFTGGSAPITTSGTFSLSQTMSLGPAQADGVETSLLYGDYPDPGDGINLGFSTHEGSEGLGLNVQSGDWMAVYQGEGCSWEVEVSANLVSGHISCTDIPTYNQADGSTGSIDVELDFNADSVPIDPDNPPPGGV